MDLPPFADAPATLENFDITWSKDSQHIAVTLISQSGLFPKNTQVHLFDVNGPYIKKQCILDIDVAFMCGSICAPVSIVLEPTQLLY